MSNQLAHAVQRLHTASGRLNQLTDQAGEAIRTIEGYLNSACSVGIPIGIVIDTVDARDKAGNPTGVQWIKTLVYRRIGKDYRIGVETGYDVDPDSWNTKPWSECDRDTKLQILTHLPQLITGLVDGIESKVSEAETALQSLMALLHTLRETGG